jgi:hypothetical protein
MGLWDNPKPIKQTTLDALLRDAKPLSPKAFKRAWDAHLVTHCKHGKLRTEHCPWCYVGTAAYRQSLADVMWDVLD